MKITVGSRKSGLALTQTQWVMDRLKDAHPDLTFDLKHIVTKGDRILNVTLSKVGGKGLFVKEIEQALLNKDIDFAVHSMKDMPAELPDGLMIACMPKREDHRDAFISKSGCGFRDLPEGAVIGTSSLRRQSQLLAARPDLRVVPLRGNIDTRLKKLESGEYDAIILAAAGLARMGWSEETITAYLPEDICLPAVGQGALAIECREDDAALIEKLMAIHDDDTAKIVSAERAFLGALEGGCQVPIAAYGEIVSAGVKLTGLVGTPDGKTIIKDTMTGVEPDAVGWTLADQLKAKGAAAILEDVREVLDQS
ncbi:hydroxymethylbilane synthase [Camelliibacillus cellulosilyticus]|uniref:Porphobilinogen deaminase n=1 Tax=Camelliibacillus cellulosilyticus TaxID=2174486 RepID=A0ABV9GLQ3_9BACL